MPCTSPLQSVYTLREDGKKNILFTSRAAATAARQFYANEVVDSENYLQLPCSQCLSCRLNRSRNWAVRMEHEAQMHTVSCFVTFTFNNDYLTIMSPYGSLDKRHMQDFNKKARYEFDRGISYSDRFGDSRIYSPDKYRYYYAGEYGDQLGRPHYHSIMFGVDFPDKVHWKTVNGCKYYTSKMLSDMWPYGFAVITDANFQTMAYVARYCVKKINGDMAEEHYTRTMWDTGEVIQLVPEFGQPSTKPGIGYEWFQKYGLTDVYPSDEVISRGYPAKPPRYYDLLLEKRDPELFRVVKAERDLRRLDNLEDNTYDRLRVKEECQDAKVKMLLRTIDAAQA